VTTHNGAEQLRDRPIGDLMKDLSRDMSRLVRQEVALAKAEMAQKVRQARLGAVMLGAAAGAGLVAAASLTAFVILLLAVALPAWAAALIVAGVSLVAAALLARKGIAKLAEATPAVPEQTIETVKEDVEWLKTRTGSASR
jgi:putative superfamily III holin-X